MKSIIKLEFYAQYEFLTKDFYEALNSLKHNKWGLMYECHRLWKIRVGVLKENIWKGFESRLLLSTKRWVITLIRVWLYEIDMMLTVNVWVYDKRLWSWLHGTIIWFNVLYAYDMN